MSQYEVAPFEMTPEFISAWNAAGAHLNLRVRDTGASWLRADLPPFREHFSFALGNQLFFIQISDHDAPDNGWMQPSRLAMAVGDANGVGCLMPMRRDGAEWVPVNMSWGLIGHQTGRPLNPFDLVTDEPVEMTAWEIHDVGVQAVREYLRRNGWTIASWQTDLSVDPSIFADKDGRMCGFLVRTSNRGPDPAGRPENAADIAALMRSRGWDTKFVGLKIGADDVHWHTDPQMQHLTRKMHRRSKLLLSPVTLEDLE